MDEHDYKELSDYRNKIIEPYRHLMEEQKKRFDSFMVPLNEYRERLKSITEGIRKQQEFDFKIENIIEREKSIKEWCNNGWILPLYLHVGINNIFYSPYSKQLEEELSEEIESEFESLFDGFKRCNFIDNTYIEEIKKCYKYEMYISGTILCLLQIERVVILGNKERGYKLRKSEYNKAYSEKIKEDDRGSITYYLYFSNLNWIDEYFKNGNDFVIENKNENMLYRNLVFHGLNQTLINKTEFLKAANNLSTIAGVIDIIK